MKFLPLMTVESMYFYVMQLLKFILLSVLQKQQPHATKSHSQQGHTKKKQQGKKIYTTHLLQLQTTYSHYTYITTSNPVISSRLILVSSPHKRHQSIHPSIDSIHHKTFRSQILKSKEVNAKQALGIKLVKQRYRLTDKGKKNVQEMQMVVPPMRPVDRQTNIIKSKKEKERLIQLKPSSSRR